jgi:hypothetical protein
MKRILFAAALTMSGAALAAGNGITAQGTDPDGMGVAPTGANEPVSIPAGATVTINPNQASVFASKPAEGAYPPCSKTVVERCVQTYEKGVRTASR